MAEELKQKDLSLDLILPNDNATCTISATDSSP